MSSLILVLNDDQNILNLYKLLLEGEGYTVSLRILPYQDIREIETLHPNLIILDLKFRDHYEGFNFLQQLKMYPPTKDIPVIVCTAALLEIQEQEPLLRDKGVPVIYKPFELEELLAVIRSASSSRSH